MTDISEICLKILFAASKFISTCALDTDNLADSVRIFSEQIQKSKIDIFTKQSISGELLIKLVNLKSSEYEINKLARNISKVNDILQKYDNHNFINRFIYGRQTIKNLSKIMF